MDAIEERVLAIVERRTHRTIHEAIALIRADLDRIVPRMETRIAAIIARVDAVANEEEDDKEDE